MREIEPNLLNEDFVDFLNALERAGVSWILVGGYAVVLHGYPRTTGDIDVWVRPTDENYDRLLRAFRDFGLPTSAIAREDFLSTAHTDVFTFGRPPVAIDILTHVKGLDFQDAFAAAENLRVDGAAVRLMSVQNLRRAKEASGRHRDFDDLENLP